MINDRRPRSVLQETVSSSPSPAHPHSLLSLSLSLFFFLFFFFVLIRLPFTLDSSPSSPSVPCIASHRKMADAEHSSAASAASADASCSAVCSTSATAGEASPPPSSVCSACGGPTASIASPPPWTDAYNAPAYRPIRAPAINAPSQTNAIILAPVPQPLPVPPATPPYHFEIPTKRISSPDDIRCFHSSAAGRHFVGFVAALSHSVRGRKISDPVPPLHQTLTTLLSLLQTLTSWIDEIPPFPHPARYGNPAYRSWHARLSAEAPALLLPLFPSEELVPAADELLPYLLDSFGNASRIDYGTGHETNFAAFLYCLARLGLIREEDYPALVTRVFVAYLELMRKLQTTYCLEPAGSHGV